MFRVLLVGAQDRDGEVVAFGHVALQTELRELRLLPGVVRPRRRAAQGFGNLDAFGRKLLRGIADVLAIADIFGQDGDRSLAVYLERGVDHFVIHIPMGGTVLRMRLEENCFSLMAQTNIKKCLMTFGLCSLKDM